VHSLFICTASLSDGNNIDDQICFTSWSLSDAPRVPPPIHVKHELTCHHQSSETHSLPLKRCSRRLCMVEPDLSTQRTAITSGISVRDPLPLSRRSQNQHPFIMLNKIRNLLGSLHHNATQLSQQSSSIRRPFRSASSSAHSRYPHGPRNFSKTNAPLFFIQGCSQCGGQEKRSTGSLTGPVGGITRYDGGRGSGAQRRPPGEPGSAVASHNDS